jgi:hypothetical protein
MTRPRSAEATPTRRACLCTLAQVRCDLGHMEDGAERGVALGPCWVRSRPANRGQQRAAVVTEREPDPQVAPPTAP